ncbi:MAG: hypothetical protein GX763_01455 [Clostridiaceae bacterium]|nr:hypothetical protein [Clostridiaceae bacterium]
MIGKLYRLEMKETGRIAKIVYPLMIFITIAGVLFSLLNIPVLASFTNTISTLALTLCAFYLIVITVRNDYHNFQGKRGYLFRSIPAKSSEFLLSRLAYYITFLWGTTFIYIFLLMAQIELSSGAPIFLLVNVFLTQVLFASPWGIGLVIFILLSGLITVIALIFAIALGSEARFHRLGAGGPVLLYIIYYIASQLLTIASMLLIPLGIKMDLDPATGSFANFELVTEGTFRYFLDSLRANADPDHVVIGIGFIFTQILLALVMVILTYRSFDKKFSLRA